MLKNLVSWHNGGWWGSLIIQIISLTGLFLSPFNHRGYWRACNLLGSFIRSKGYKCFLKLNASSNMIINLSDPYWLRLVSRFFIYEPELHYVLMNLKSTDYCFLDCGANFGYWSILVSCSEYGCHKALAVEASYETYQNLVENSKINQNRFSCLNYAVSSDSNRIVILKKGYDPLSDGSHAGAYVTNSSDEKPLENPNHEICKTITIDDLVQSMKLQAAPLIIKLDVEGEEVNALLGAKKALTQETLLIYEDHGKDKTCKASSFVLDFLKLSVFYIDRDKSIYKIDSIKKVKEVKKREALGYNFFACSRDSGYFVFFNNAHAIRSGCRENIMEEN